MDIKERLTHKLGPLPVWAWMGAAGVGVAAISMLGKKGGGAAAGGESSSSPSTPKQPPFIPIIPTVPSIGNPPIGDSPIGQIPTTPSTISAATLAGTAVGRDAGKWVLTQNSRTGTQDIGIINNKGETSGPTWKQILDPNQNPLWKLFKAEIPIQAAKEANNVSPEQAGRGVPVGVRPDGSIILAYGKSSSTLAPVVTIDAAAAAPRMIANSPNSTTEKQGTTTPNPWPTNNGSGVNFKIINEQATAAHAAGEQLTVGQQMYLDQQAAASTTK